MTDEHTDEIDSAAEELFGDHSEKQVKPLKRNELPPPEPKTVNADVVIQMINIGAFDTTELRMIKNAAHDKLGDGRRSLTDFSSVPVGAKVKFYRDVTRRAKWPSGYYYGIVEKHLQKRVRVQIYVDPKCYDSPRNPPNQWKVPPSILRVITEDEWKRVLSRFHRS